MTLLGKPASSKPEPRFLVRYLGNVVLGAMWFPLAFLLLLFVTLPLEGPLRYIPAWLDFRISFSLSVFACPTGATVAAVLFYFYRQTRWWVNFVLTVLASLAMAVFAYYFGKLESGWIGF
jgi:hypothetical protein